MEGIHFAERIDLDTGEPSPWSPYMKGEIGNGRVKGFFS